MYKNRNSQEKVIKNPTVRFLHQTFRAGKKGVGFDISHKIYLDGFLLGRNEISVLWKKKAITKKVTSIKFTTDYVWPTFLCIYIFYFRPDFFLLVDLRSFLKKRLKRKAGGKNVYLFSNSSKWMVIVRFQSRR